MILDDAHDTPDQIADLVWWQSPKRRQVCVQLRGPPSYEADDRRPYDHLLPYRPTHERRRARRHSRRDLPMETNRAPTEADQAAAQHMPDPEQTGTSSHTRRPSAMTVRRVRSLLRKPVIQAILAVGVVVVGAGLVLFEPWQLWVDKTINETLPGADPHVVIAHGTLVSHQHKTSGTVRILRLADGSRLLRLENLDTTSGPDLKVWLTDAAVQPGKAGHRVFDDGRHLNLGQLKGNKGSQNYLIPRSADLAQYRSVTLWWDRFNVSFGVAALVEG